MASLWFYNVLIFLNKLCVHMYSIIIKNAHGLFKN